MEWRHHSLQPRITKYRSHMLSSLFSKITLIKIFQSYLRSCSRMPCFSCSYRQYQYQHVPVCFQMFSHSQNTTRVIKICNGTSLANWTQPCCFGLFVPFISNANQMHMRIIKILLQFVMGLYRVIYPPELTSQSRVFFSPASTEPTSWSCLHSTLSPMARPAPPRGVEHSLRQQMNVNPQCSKDAKEG